MKHENIGSQQRVGGGMRHDGVANSATPDQDQAVEDSGEGSGEPAVAMQKAEGYRRHQESDPCKASKRRRLEIRRAQTAYEETAKRELFRDGDGDYGGKDPNGDPGNLRQRG